MVTVVPSSLLMGSILTDLVRSVVTARKDGEVPELEPVGTADERLFLRSGYEAFSATQTLTLHRDGLIRGSMLTLSPDKKTSSLKR